MLKKFSAISLIFVTLVLTIAAPAFAKGTTRTPVSYFECATLDTIEKQWFPDGNTMIRNASYVSDILDYSDPRLSGTLYGNEKVINVFKDGSAFFQGTVRIELPDGVSVWEGTWNGKGIFGVNWQIDIVLHGVAGEVEGLKANITTTSDDSYWCANSIGEIVNPADK